MDIEALKIQGAWMFTPRQFGDERGIFMESYKSTLFAETTGRTLDVKQMNYSISAAGALRGIHCTANPPGQAKYVTCASGAVLDVIVDLRVGSPTFGEWDAVVLEGVERRAVFLSEGLGHAFLALEDNSAVIYLCGIEYTPSVDFGINPLDPEIGIEWPVRSQYDVPLQFQLSSKDEAAPSLAEAKAAGLLPKFV